jgi:peptidoglycan/xylan/chitin deacetylase (PgdA/CDA1 family)
MPGSDSLNVCITFDFDAMCVWGEVFQQYSPTPISRGEFGARVAVPRLLKILEREGVKAAFFTPGHTIDTYPDLCKQILAEGHEIGHHGYFHEGPVTLEEAEERAVLEKGLEAMDKNLDGYKPVGYRSPAFDLSPNSTKLLREYGFKYDSSMMAQDFEPYWCREGDEMPRDRRFQFGPEVELVEVPVSWSLDDFVQLEYVFSPVGILAGAHNPKEIEERWIADMVFAAEEVPGGVYNMTFHPQCIGRGARIRIVENMIAKAKELGANLVTPSEVAESWAAGAPERKAAGAVAA